MRTFIMIALVLVGAGTVSAQQPAVYNFSSPVQNYPAGYAPRPMAPGMQPGTAPTGPTMMPTPMATPQPSYFNNAAGCDAGGCDASGNGWNGGRGFGLGGNGGGCDGGNCGAGGCDSGNCGGGNGGGLFGGGLLGGLFNRCNGVGGASGCGVYHSLFGGFSSPSNMNFEIRDGYTITGDVDDDPDLDFKDGWLVGRAWGRQLNCNWRAEIETSYRNNSASDIELAGVGFTDNAGKLNLLSGMVNLVRDLRPMGRAGEIRPYFGAGAGVSFVDLEVNVVDPAAGFLDSRDSTFAYQAFFGVAHKVRNCVDLYTEYRFFGTDKFAIETTGFGGPDSSVEGSLTQHNILFGMRVWVR